MHGDGNCNEKNLPRCQSLHSFLRRNSLQSVSFTHCTYHHFVGDGKFDSFLDLILHSHPEMIRENVKEIFCIKDYPEISSHHDLILSSFNLPL